MNAKTFTTITAILMLVGGTAHAHDFSWGNLLMARIKLDETFDYDAYVDSYMQAFRPVVWKRYRGDEFELEDKRQETVKIMRDRVAEFSLDETFTLNTSLTLGKYDFAKQEFPIKESTESNYWYENKYGVGDLPSNFRVFFRNPEVIASLSMSKDLARTFVARRKDRYGNVNRRIQASIRFTLVKLKNGRDEFLARIESARFYDDEGRTRLVAEIQRSSVPPRHSEEE